MSPDNVYRHMRYCANCWETLQDDGMHRPAQPCTDPSGPLSCTELDGLIRSERGQWR